MDAVLSADVGDAPTRQAQYTCGRSHCAGRAAVWERQRGAPVLLVVRMKVVDEKLTEIELVATRSRSEGLIFNIDGLSAPSAVMNYAPRSGQRAARDAAIKAALYYPEGSLPRRPSPP